MSTETTDFLLLFRGGAPDKSVSPEEMQRFVEKWTAWYDGLEAEGKVVGGQPLEREGRVVRGADPVVTDGPFSEAKETVGGFFHLKVSGFDEATEIAKNCPGLANGGIVEVRQIADCCHDSAEGQQK